MKRHKWSEIKVRTSAETRARIDDESRDLSNQLRRAQRLTGAAEAKEPSPKSRKR
jgi:hypothetical protein